MRRLALARSAILAAIAATLVTAGTSRAATDGPDQGITISGLEVAVWRPTSSPGRHPLVLFSHGLGGCKIQSSHLMRALAREGMLVVAPDHADKGARCPDGLPKPDELLRGFSDSASSGPSFQDGRRKDLQELRAALQTDLNFSAIIDTSRVALVGHSLGGYTVLGLAGAWPSWKMGGITAVVALAPFVQPFIGGGTPAGIGVPVLFQTGTEDTWARDELGFHAATPSPTCRVVYQGADHFAWTDLQDTFQRPIAADTATFLKAVFAGNRPTATILTPLPTARSSCR
jgi:dienelactone hydrolase